jgi:hypothetical protein
MLNKIAVLRYTLWGELKQKLVKSETFANSKFQENSMLINHWIQLGKNPIFLKIIAMNNPTPLKDTQENKGPLHFEFFFFKKIRVFTRCSI